MINRKLAEQQKLTEREVVAIEEIQKHLKAFLARPTMYANEEDVSDIVTGFEYVLQYLFKFPLDRKFHRYQNDLAGCCCPRFDNLDLVGIETARWVNENCPHHNY